MTRRDRRWKLGGFALLASSWALCVVLDSPPATIILFLLALAGLPLMIHGKRVGQRLRAERRGHSHTVVVVRAARIRRRGQGEDGFGPQF